MPHKGISVDTKIIEGLRAAVEAAYPVPPHEPGTRIPMTEQYKTRCDLLEALKTEEFWSERAPKMTDELLILRQLESHARAHVAQEPEHKRSTAFACVISQIDEFRVTGKLPVAREDAPRSLGEAVERFEADFAATLAPIDEAASQHVADIERVLDDALNRTHEAIMNPPTHFSGLFDPEPAPSSSPVAGAGA